MMKALLLVGLAAASMVGSAKADPVGDELTAKADQCIQTAAPKVGSVTPSLTDAVNFLVEDLCASEINRADTYASNLGVLAGWQATTASAQLVGVTVDPTSGELKSPPGFAPPMNTSAMMMNIYRNPGAPQARYRSLAAKTVLAAKTQPSPH